MSCLRLDVPDYYHDLNAIHEVVMAIDLQLQGAYAEQLKIVVEMTRDDLPWVEAGSFAHVEATVAQRCEAYLRAIGKWEEQPEFKGGPVTINEQ